MYSQFINFTGEVSPYIIRDIDGAVIPNDPNNADWQIYQEWLALGNKPEPPALVAPQPDKIGEGK